MRFVISGYYGFENSGDDALLLTIIRQIKKDYSDAQITVLSKSPKNTKSEYGVNSVNRYNPIAILWYIFKCDLFVSGGGTLIQDETSTKSLIYYLALIKTALFFKKKVMLYANGIGPLTSFKNIEKTKNILNRVDLITLRDNQSLAELEHIGVDKPHIFCSNQTAPQIVFLKHTIFRPIKKSCVFQYANGKKILLILSVLWRIFAIMPQRSMNYIRYFCQCRQ